MHDPNRTPAYVDRIAEQLAGLRGEIAQYRTEFKEGMAEHTAKMSDLGHDMVEVVQALRNPNNPSLGMINKVSRLEEKVERLETSLTRALNLAWSAMGSAILLGIKTIWDYTTKK